MKYLIAIAFTFFSISIFAQGKFDVQGDLAPTGAYGIVKARNLKGGYLGSVHDTVARNLIPITYRDSNTLVFTRVDSTMWILKGGLTNDYWSVLSTGGSGLDTTKVPYTGANQPLISTFYIQGSSMRSDTMRAATSSGFRMYSSSGSEIGVFGAGGTNFGNYVGRQSYRTNINGSLSGLDFVPKIYVDSVVAGSAVTGKVYSGNGLANVNDSTLRTDTSLTATKDFVNYKDDIQQGFIDMRKLDADSSAWTGYATRARLQQQFDSAKFAQAVINGVQNDTLTSHNTRILANTNAANTNAANINLKVNIADTASMLAGYKVATILTSGTLADARLSSNVPLKNTANTFTENQTISKSNPQLDIISATTAKASLLRGETTNTFSLTNDVLEIGGALSNCISFNNTSQYIDANPTNITGLTQWTFACWINRLSTNSSNIVYIGNGTNALQLLITGSTSLQLQARGALYGTAYATIPSSGWVHIAVVYSGGNVFIYVNGSLNVTSTIGSVASVTKFRIGNAVLLPNYNAFGYSVAPTNQPIDQVLFYNTALIAGSISTIYASGTGTTSLPSTGNLLLRYELNEGTGTTTVNQGTASNGNGTLVNGVAWGIANGKIPTEAAIQLGTAINIGDGILSGERGQYRFGDPFGGTIIRGRSIKFQAPLETNFSFIHNGTSTLIDPANTNTSATGASTVSVVGNASIGENVAAPTNGLRVVGNALFRANTFFGGTTTPTARVHVLASSTSASGGQIKLIGGGSRQTVAENGTINNISGNLEFVDASTVYILAKTLQNSATLDFGSTASLSKTTLTITVKGVADGDQVSLGVPNGSMTAGLIYFAWVSAVDTVSIQCYNSTLGDIDPASGTFKISVIKQ